jgi:uncharacterized membrane protein YfhO
MVVLLFLGSQPFYLAFIQQMIVISYVLYQKQTSEQRRFVDVLAENRGKQQIPK